MSDIEGISIQPVPPVSGPAPVQPVQHEPGRTPTPDSGAKPPARPTDVAASVGGSLPSAYAQLVVNPDTRDVVIRIRDASTDEIIHEYPSSEVENMAKYLKQYVATLARRHAEHLKNVSH
jgi:hypothetical protein